MEDRRLVLIGCISSPPPPTPPRLPLSTTLSAAPSCRVPNTPWKWRKCHFPSYSSKLCPPSTTAHLPLPPWFSSDEISSQREYFGPVLCSQTNSPGSFNLVSINIITVCSVISTGPWFVHVIHALASTSLGLFYIHTLKCLYVCIYILHVMHGYRVLKEGYVSIMPVISFIFLHLNARHLHWAHCENPWGSVYFFKNSYVNSNVVRVINCGQTSYLPSVNPMHLMELCRVMWAICLTHALPILWAFSPWSSFIF